MKVISFFSVLIVLAAVAYAQEDPAPASVADPEPVWIQFQELESLTIGALRREFPRLSGVFASAHSCRLPDYGPLVSVTIQLPAYYFTKPVLQELDRRQRMAEQQARKVRSQLERASRLISLRSKEANLLERIEWEASSKKKSKQVMEDLQAELSEVRKSLSSLENEQPQSLLIVQEIPDVLQDIDLNKMLVSNYQQLVQRVSKSLKNALAEHGPRVAGLQPEERVTLNAYIRDNIVGSQGRTILFILRHEDIQQYKDGMIGIAELRDRVTVHEEPIQ